MLYLSLLAVYAVNTFLYKTKTQNFMVPCSLLSSFAELASVNTSQENADKPHNFLVQASPNKFRSRDVWLQRIADTRSRKDPFSLHYVGQSAVCQVYVPWRVVKNEILQL